MTIGVIIPTYNEQGTITKTLTALQPLAFDEVIMVDGGSHDRTQELAEAQFQREQWLQGKVIKASRGRASQMNAGVAVSQADVVVFLHADSWLPSDARPAMEEAMRIPACIGGRFDVQFEADKGYAWVVSRMMNLRSRWTGIATGDQAIFVRRAMFQQLGGFADIPIMEDIEFTRRLKRAGQTVALRSKVTTSFRRWEQQGPLRTILQMWTLRFLYSVGMSPHTLNRFYGTIQ